MRIKITEIAGILQDLPQIKCSTNCGCLIEVQNMSPRIPEVIPDPNLHLFAGDIVNCGSKDEVIDPETEIWLTDEIANEFINLGWGIKI